MPKLDEDLMKEMIEDPFGTKSDSFYFVGDKLIMHTKAEYDFSYDDEEMWLINKLQI